MNNANNSKGNVRNSHSKNYEHIFGSNVYDPEQNKDEKRLIRKEYRSLIEETEENRQEYLRPDSDGLEKNLVKSNELYKRVKNPHEATLDSRLLVLSSNLGLQKARRMRLDNNCFDTEDYLSKILSHLRIRNVNENVHYNWKKIGKIAAQSTLRVPTIGFILGPLSIEKKERQKSVRKVLEKHEKDLRTPVQLKENDIKRRENETTRNVRMIYDILGKNQPINFFKFVINPESFSQTVENLFYLSFLVRDGKVSIDDETGQPILSLCEQPTSEDYVNGLIKKQLIMEIDMETWKEIIDVYNITRSVIPTRKSNRVENDGKWYG